MLIKLDEFSEPLAQVESYDFDVFKVDAAVGRENTFVMTIFKIMNDLPKAESEPAMISNDKLINFLKHIFSGYR